MRFSEALVQQSKSLEKSSDNSKTFSHKRRLYSSADIPKLIKLNDYDDILFPLPAIYCSLLPPEGQRKLCSQ
jgi:hypothetical protein